MQRSQQMSNCRHSVPVSRDSLALIARIVHGYAGIAQQAVHAPELRGKFLREIVNLALNAEQMPISSVSRATLMAVRPVVAENC